MQVYSDPSRESDPHALPDVEVFHAARGELWKAGESRDGWEPDEDNGAGWYYWFCFPGCMPESDAQGPYRSAKAAATAAQEDA